MPDPFHRLNANPSGYDAFPSGYDFINNPALNGNAGVPANADGKKVGGPNDGTYYVGFGEDVTSLDANRGFQALAQNTDFLDAAIRRPLAVPTRTADVTAGAPVASILLPDASGVFLGSAVQAIPETLLTLFEILDNNDNEIIIPDTGVRCVVTAAAGGAIGSGFSAGAVTLTVTPSIPTGVTYRVYYANKSNLLLMPTDTFTVIKIRGAQELPAGFEDFQKQISRVVATNIVAVVGTIFETPDGVRLAKSNSQAFDVDPDGTVGSIHRFFWRMKRDVGGATTLLEINDDNSLGGAALGRFRIFSGGVHEFIGTGLFRDANIAAGAAQGGAFIPLTSATGALGDQYLRTLEKGSVGSAITPTFMRSLNAKWTVTVGDGTSSFGDFSGIDAIQQVLAYRTAVASTAAIHIKMKKGAYAISDATTVVALPSNVEVTIEGVDASDVTITLTSTAAAITLGTATILRLKNLVITRSSGSTTGMTETANSRVYATDCQFFNFSMHWINAGKAVAGSTTGAPAHMYNRCHFETNALGLPPIVWEFNDAATQQHTGFILEDCVVYINDTNTPAMRIQAGSASVLASICDGFRFTRSDFYLGSSTVSGANPVGNSGVIDYFDNGNVAGGTLLVNSVKFMQCNVYSAAANSVNATAMLLNITNLTSVISAGLIEIDGGKWLNYKLSPTLTTFLIGGNGFGAFFTAPAKVLVKNITTGWATAGDYSGTGTTTGANYGAMPANFNGAIAANLQAAYFIGSVWGEVKNITFVGTASQHSTSGLFWMDGQQTIDVDGIYGVPSQTGSGTTARYIVKFSPSFGGGSGSLSLAAFRHVRRVVLEGYSILSSFDACLIAIPFGLLTVEDCMIFSQANAGAGMTMPFTDPVYALFNSSVAGLKIHRCRFDGGINGLYILHLGSGGLATVVQDLEIVACTAVNNTNYGIAIYCNGGGATSCAFPGLHLKDNTAHGNTAYQIACFPSAFSGQAPTVQGNTVIATGSTDLLAIGTQQNAGTDYPAFTVQGNSVQQGSSFGGIGLRLVNGIALPAHDSSGTGANINKVRGVETGLNATPTDRDFTGGILMTQNFASLVGLP